jgi:hypothetical protein
VLTVSIHNANTVFTFSMNGCDSLVYGNSGYESIMRDCKSKVGNIRIRN